MKWILCIFGHNIYWQTVDVAYCQNCGKLFVRTGFIAEQAQREIDETKKPIKSVVAIGTPPESGRAVGEAPPKE